MVAVRWPGKARDEVFSAADQGEVAMRDDEAVSLYTLLTGQGVRVWVGGGWGIDALLGEQTRPHKDFDAPVSLDDLSTLANVLANCGLTLKEIWGKNRWVAHPVQLPVIGRRELGISAVATAFVVRESASLELDIHVLTLNGRGCGIPAWNADITYSPDALAGQGVIAGTRVRCLSARMQMATHTG
jgi:lincosamide nucleotidyltransferase A/C/D/E